MLYIYLAAGGTHGGCSEYMDWWACALITEADRDTMMARITEAANRQGDKYEHYEFLKVQEDGILLDTVGSTGIDAYAYIMGIEAETIELDRIDHETLWTEETRGRVMAERTAAIRAEKLRHGRYLLSKLLWNRPSAFIPATISEVFSRDDRYTEWAARNTLAGIEEDYPELADEIAAAKVLAAAQVRVASE